MNSLALCCCFAVIHRLGVCCSLCPYCSLCSARAFLIYTTSKGEKFNWKGEKFNWKGEKFNWKGEKFNWKGEIKTA